METTSPFQPATAIPKRLKAFFYGAPGVGKTILSLHFPGVTLIDLERGTDHYGGQFQFSKLPTVSLDEIVKAVTWLKTSQHEYRTLVIDPLTIYWDMIQTKWSDIFGRKKGSKDPYTFEPKDWKPMRDEFREFLRLLSEVDMNVIATAHEKPQYSDSQFMQKTGETFDCEKHAGYLFDVVGRIYTTTKGERMIRLLKDRTNLLPREDFPADFSEFEKCLGKEKLEAKAVPVPVAPVFVRASQDQQNEVRALAKQAGGTIADAKKAAGLPVEPLSVESAVKLIAYLKSVTAEAA
jgi:phage nucleotide-binding protein